MRAGEIDRKAEDVRLREKLGMTKNWSERKVEKEKKTRVCGWVGGGQKDKGRNVEGPKIER